MPRILLCAALLCVFVGLSEAWNVRTRPKKEEKNNQPIDCEVKDLEEWGDCMKQMVDEVTVWLKEKKQIVVTPSENGGKPCPPPEKEECLNATELFDLEIVLNGEHKNTEEEEEFTNDVLVQMGTLDVNGGLARMFNLKKRGKKKKKKCKSGSSGSSSGSKSGSSSCSSSSGSSSNSSSSDSSSSDSSSSDSSSSDSSSSDSESSSGSGSNTSDSNSDTSDNGTDSGSNTSAGGGTDSSAAGAPSSGEEDNGGRRPIRPYPSHYPW